MASNKELAEEWLKFAIQNWQAGLKKLRIRNTGDLFNSFKGSVLEQAGGDRLRVEIAYAWYGQMVDMGVGRGTRSGEQKDQATERRLLGKGYGKQRKPKRWYSKGRDGIGYQTHRLSELLGIRMAYSAVDALTENLDKKIEIEI